MGVSRYIEYQTALRKTIEESSYADPVDWWFQAFAEVAGIRFTHSSRSECK